VAYRSKEHDVWNSLVTLVPADIVTVIVKGGLIMIPLLVAIVTLIPYNYLRARVEEMTEVLEERATRLELLLIRQED
jgi:hypothetical protein